MLIIYCHNKIHLLINPFSFFGRWWHRALKGQSEDCNYSEWVVPDTFLD